MGRIERSLAVFECVIGSFCVSRFLSGVLDGFFEFIVHGFISCCRLFVVLALNCGGSGVSNSTMNRVSQIQTTRFAKIIFPVGNMVMAEGSFERQDPASEFWHLFGYQDAKALVLLLKGLGVGGDDLPNYFLGSATIS
jgi:hypothetical protein